VELKSRGLQFINTPGNLQVPRSAKAAGFETWQLLGTAK